MLIHEFHAFGSEAHPFDTDLPLCLMAHGVEIPFTQGQRGGIATATVAAGKKTIEFPAAEEAILRLIAQSLAERIEENRRAFFGGFHATSDGDSFRPSLLYRPFGADDSPSCSLTSFRKPPTLIEEVVDFVEGIRMGGVNPYIEKARSVKATQKFTVTFFNEETGETKVVAVDPAQIPYGRTGLDGSLLDIALGAGIEMDHACGGVCACATCHVHVKEGLPTCSEATDDEMDQLDAARDVTLESRLSCQCVPDGTQNLLVEIPSWNTNFVKEGH